MYFTLTNFCPFFPPPFRNLQLKKIKRGDKKSNEAVNVTEEKYSILFQTEFTLGDEKLFFPVSMTNFLVA
jgi:hypothetical protein